METTIATPMPAAPRRIAPGPRGNFLTGNLAAFKRSPVQMFLDLQRDHGDVARNRMGPLLTHVLSHPKAIEHVLASNAGNYVRGQLYERFKLFFGNGLLTTDGEYWMRHRRIAQPNFHKRRLDAMTGVIADCGERMVERWRGSLAERQPFDLVPETIRVSLSVLSRTMFNVDLIDSAPKLGPAVEFAIATMLPQTSPYRMLPTWMPTGFNRRIERARAAIHEVVLSVVEERRRKTDDVDDLVSMFLEARDEETGQPLTDVEIRDEVATTLLAGHETSATGLAWTLYALSRYPAVRRRLCEELDSVLAGRAPTLEDLPRLPYLRQVVEESLRLYPPIFVYMRDSVADDEIGGYHIPARSTVFISTNGVHRHPDFWENPEAFDPDRFSPEQAAKRHRYAYLPFGGGQRKCIGFHLALLQMQIIVAIVTQRCELHAVPGLPIDYGHAVSLRPSHGMLMTYHPHGARVTA